MHEALEALRLLTADYGVDLNEQSVLEQLAEQEDEDKELALAVFLNSTDVEHVYRDTYRGDGGEYLVLTDEEAEDALEEYLDQLLDEPGLVEGAGSPYFDHERWKRDAKIDGRGHFLASYDGNEEEQGDFFIYRIG